MFLNSKQNQIKCKTRKKTSTSVFLLYTLIKIFKTWFPSLDYVKQQKTVKKKKKKELTNILFLTTSISVSIETNTSELHFKAMESIQSWQGVTAYHLVIWDISFYALLNRTYGLGYTICSHMLF